MGKKYTSGIVTAATFQFNGESPLDDRLVVENYSDLSSLYKYIGMLVYVADEEQYYTYNGSSWSLFAQGGEGGSCDCDTSNFVTQDQILIDYSQITFDTSEIIIGSTAILGTAVLGQMVLG